MKRSWIVAIALLVGTLTAQSQEKVEKTFNGVRYFDHATKNWSPVKKGTNTFIFYNDPIDKFEIVYHSGKVETFVVLSPLYLHQDPNDIPYVLASITDDRGKEGTLHAYRNDMGELRYISISFDDYWLSIQFLNEE